MIAATANYLAAAANRNLKPVFRFSIANYSKVFVTRPQSTDLQWISNISDWAVSVDPLNASYTIDDLTVTVIDVRNIITADVSLLLLQGRRCTLQSGFDGLALADYCTLFTGIVSNITNSPDGTYDFVCSDFNRLSQQLVFTRGGGSTVTTTVTTQNPNVAYTTTTQVQATDPLTSVVTTTGSVSYSSSGPTGPAGTVYTTSGSSRITTVTTSRTVNNTTIYEQTVTTVGVSTTTIVTTTYGGQNLYTNIATIAVTDGLTLQTTSSVSFSFTLNGPVGTVVTTDSGLISSSNPRRYTGHPMNMVLDILVNQIGLANSDVNVTQIESYRDTVFTGVEFDFILTGSVDAKDFIENQLLKPLGGYLYVNYLSQFCIGFAQPAVGGISAIAAITPDNLTELPTINTSPLTNVLTLRFDKDDSNQGSSSTGYLAESNTFYAPTITNLTDLTGTVIAEALTGASAVQGQLIIESGGMRSGFQGFILSKMIANSIFAMYGSYNPAFTAPCHWYPFFQVEVGEFITFTHPLVADRQAGVLGMHAKLFRVVKRSYNFESMIVTLDLQDASGIAAFGAHRIAPSNTSARQGPNDRSRYLFMTNVSGTYNDGSNGVNIG